MTLPKAYIAKDYESNIYSQWEQAGVFQPRGKGDPFSIVLPPPNATGQLHLGHAVMIAIEDAIVRYNRMQGKDVLWVPGTDHAAIATENVVINKLREEGHADPRAELGREEVLKHIQEFVAGSQETIRKQIRATGASVDWTRERYTMEPAMNNVVSQVFEKMYNDGLIYRGRRIVNWDPNLKTTVSDDEVEHKDNVTPFYTFKYGPFEISTARPETKFGDKYVVMHPEDQRYAEYKHGQTFEAQWLNGTITATVIKDEVVDPEFGTGVMTITPWHDHTDFEIAQRHKLDVQQVIDFDGNLLDVAGEFKGQNILQARPNIVEKLKQMGLLVNVEENYHHRIATNSRGHGLIEPQIMEQWFIDVNAQKVRWKGRKHSLKEIMRMVVEKGNIKIIPERFDKTYYHWIDNLHDWCISRQIWWGHRIPAWYRTKAGEQGAEREVYVGRAQPEGDGWQQDPDTLDTWFSSSMWTWSTLLDKEMAEQGVDLEKLLKKSKDYQRFHPTTLLETGYDIIFFWVARMILMTTYVTGEVPFKNVYLHGLVRTREGVKMSKSKPETAIDPLEVIPEYGADALRLSMIIGQSPGNDNRLYKEKIAAYRNFCNKLWNVGRFIEAMVDADELTKKAGVISPADAWMFNRLQQAVTQTTQQMSAFRLSDAGQTVYSLLWDDFADWYIEASKAAINGPLLAEMFRTILKLTHPLAPYVTEVLWQQVGGKGTLATAEWPKPQKLADEQMVDVFEEVRSIVTEIRELSSDLQVEQTRLYYQESEFIEEVEDLIVKMTGIKEVKQVVDGEGIHLTKTSIRCWLDIEVNAMRSYLFRLIRRRDEQTKMQQTFKTKLNNKQYTSNAPKELVEETRIKLRESKDYVERLKLQIEKLEQMIRLYKN